jgi:hypothetical protein
VMVGVDDVFYVQTLIFQYLNYRIRVEARVDNGSFFSGIVCNNVREVVALVFDLLKEHSVPS